MALELGSDVPFFIHGKATWAEGRGELFTTINLKPEWYLLIFPETSISTRDAFSSISISKDKLISSQDFLKGISINTFSDWAKNRYPEIKKTFSLLESIGSPRLTGTGSTIFVSFSDRKKAILALNKFPMGTLVKSLDHSPLKQLIE